MTSRSWRDTAQAHAKRASARGPSVRVYTPQAGRNGPRLTVYASQPERPGTGADRGVRAGRRPVVPLGDAPSLLPPGAEPPNLPHADEDDSTRSVRAWVLSACFTFGILLGFLYHVTKPEPVAVDSPDRGTESGSGIKDLLSHDDREEARPVASVEQTPPETEGTDTDTLKEQIIGLAPTDPGLADLDLTRRLPSPLPKRPYGGPSGRNMPQPYASERRTGPDGFGEGLSPDLPVGGGGLSPDLEF